MMNLAKSFIANKSGSTAIEYGLIAAGIVFAAVPVLEAFIAVASSLFGTASVTLTAPAH